METVKMSLPLKSSKLIPCITHIASSYCSADAFGWPCNRVVISYNLVYSSPSAVKGPEPQGLISFSVGQCHNKPDTIAFSLPGSHFQWHKTKPWFSCMGTHLRPFHVLRVMPLAPRLLLQEDAGLLKSVLSASHKPVLNSLTHLNGPR